MRLRDLIAAAVDCLRSTPRELKTLTAAIREIRLTESQERQRRVEAKDQIRIQRWIAGGTWAAVFAASVYAAITCGQWVEMRKQTIAANRAWISPFAANPAADPRTKRLQAEVQFLDVGKSPARALSWKYKIMVVPTPENDDWGKIKVTNASCDELAPDDKTGGVIYPGTSRSDAFLKEFVSDDPPIYADADLIQGKTTALIYGCVAYRTMSIVGRSGFCFIFARTNYASGPQGVTVQCQTGDRAE
jgi:hypothetical protein